MTGSRSPESPASASAGLGTGAGAEAPRPGLWRRLVAGDPTALADSYTHYADRLLTAAASGHAPAQAAAVVRSVFARLWEHPLGFPAGDAALGEALAAATENLLAEQTLPRHQAPRAHRPPPVDGARVVDPRAELLAAALAHRPAAAAAPPYAEPFAAWTATVDRVLAELTIADWDRPVLGDGRTTREIVARLAGLDAALADALGIPGGGAPARVDTPARGVARPTGVPPGGGGDAIGMGKRPVVSWPPVFWPPVLLWRTWHEGARGLCASLAGREEQTAASLVDALGWTAPVADQLTTRMLGAWLDGSAIAATAGLRLPSLETATAREAAALILARLRPADTAAPLTVVLTTADDTGRGQSPLGRFRLGAGRPPHEDDEPAAREPALRLDLRDLCLLATGRRSAAQCASVAVFGEDPGPGHAVLAAAEGVLPG